MTTAKIQIPSRVDQSQTEHLLPVIAFLKELGNRPSSVDGFEWDRDGHATYTFTFPIDTEALVNHFEFPADIHVVDGRYLEDARNRVRIAQRIQDDQRAEYFASVVEEAIGS